MKKVHFSSFDFRESSLFILNVLFGTKQTLNFAYQLKHHVPLIFLGKEKKTDHTTPHVENHYKKDLISNTTHTKAHLSQHKSMFLKVSLQ